MKKTLLIISAIALGTTALASGNPDKAAACSKKIGTKAACCPADKSACCPTDKAACAEKRANCTMDQAECDAKRAACDAKRAACTLKTDAEKAACDAKKATTKKLNCGGCPMPK